MSSQDGSHWAVIREKEIDGVRRWEGMVVPGDVDPEAPWDELGERAVLSWGGG